MAASSLLKNKYWILRHGKSIPNQKGLIVSSLENGVLPEYQLAELGVKQAQLAGEQFQKIPQIEPHAVQNFCLGAFTLIVCGSLLETRFLKDLKDANIPLENVRICYSPFARTAHTAKVVASVLNLPFEGSQCKVFEDLRERYFGPSYELSSHDRYPEIWALDEKDPFQRPEGGECAADVVSRLLKAIGEMEAMFEGCAILIVSHGDPLQMLQTILNAAKEYKESSCSSYLARLEAVKVPSVLSQHRKFALETGELRSVV